MNHSKNEQLMARKAAATPRGVGVMGTFFAERAEGAAQLVDAVANELDTPVAARQGVEDLAVEDEHAPDLARGPQGVVQRGVVVGAQIAAKPDEGTVQWSLHGEESAAGIKCAHVSHAGQFHQPLPHRDAGHGRRRF